MPTWQRRRGAGVGRGVRAEDVSAPALTSGGVYPRRKRAAIELFRRAPPLIAPRVSGGGKPRRSSRQVPHVFRTNTATHTGPSPSLPSAFEASLPAEGAGVIVDFDAKTWSPALSCEACTPRGRAAISVKPRRHVKAGHLRSSRTNTATHTGPSPPPAGWPRMPNAGAYCSAAQRAIRPPFPSSPNGGSPYSLKSRWKKTTNAGGC